MDVLTDAYEGQWALILGASSGFGEAISIELARWGMNIFGVHLDRRATLPNVERIMEIIKSMGRQAVFFNINAADADKRRGALDEMEEILKREDSTIRVFVHSLAFASLKPFVGEGPQESITEIQMTMTMDVMAHTLVYWVQELVWRGMMGRDGRIFALTSSGSQRVWPSYGATSGAKAALESHIRQLALELAPLGITANAIKAGVTDTPALRKIPGHERLMERAMQKNPMGRLTRPEDVAKAIAVLSHPNTYWMTGNVIAVDGGEDITG